MVALKYFAAYHSLLLFLLSQLQTRAKSNYHGVVLINFYANPFLSASCITSSASHDCRPPSAFLPSFIIPVFSDDHLPALSLPHSSISVPLSLFLAFSTSPLSSCPFFRVTRGESFSPSDRHYTLTCLMRFEWACFG